MNMISKLTIRCFAVLALLGACAAAQANTTFTTETGPHSIAAFSTSDKPARCEVHILFTFMHNGERKEGDTICTMKDVPAGENVEFCTVSHERMIEPIITGLEPKCE